jgi:hypothetical protein
MIKLIWVAVMFLITVGALFLASFGIDIQTAYYDKSEDIVVNRTEI